MGVVVGVVDRRLAVTIREDEKTRVKDRSRVVTGEGNRGLLRFRAGRATRWSGSRGSRRPSLNATLGPAVATSHQN